METNSSSSTPTEESESFIYNLDCGHSVWSDVVLRQQYSTDVHYILCPSCEHDKDQYGRVPTAWRPVTGVTNANVSDVFGRYARVLPDRIMRIQPRYRSRPNRVRPFPYIKGVRK